MQLANGLIVADAAIFLALRLEEQGHALVAKDGVLLVSNGAVLSNADRAEIQKYKRHLLAIAGYDAEVQAPALTSVGGESAVTVAPTAPAPDPAPLGDPRTDQGQSSKGRVRRTSEIRPKPAPDMGLFDA